MEAAFDVGGSHEWAQQQWGAVDLGDERLNRRAVQIGAAMASRPGATLPVQLGDWAPLKATYRFLSNDKVSHAQLSEPHWAETRAQAARQPVVLWIEDTTDLDYSRYSGSMKGLGEFGKFGRGLMLHSTLGVIPEGRQVLGLGHQQVSRPRVRPKGEKKRRRPQEERESRVWLDSLAALGKAPSASQQVVVTDREGDFNDFLLMCRQQGYHFLVRAFHQHRIQTDPGKEPAYLMSCARSWDARVERYVDVPAHGKRSPHSTKGVVPARRARRAHVLVSWGAVSIRTGDGWLPVWVVRAWEVDAPEGVEAIEWVLMTTVPVNSAEDALERLEWYECRWLIEDYHQCLKTGCTVEERDFGQAATVERLLGFLGPIAARLLQMRETARLDPELPATAIVEETTVRVLAARLQVQAAGMSVRAFWRGVAKLGGFLGRRGDGEPGWKTLWKGWLYLEMLVEGATLAQSLAADRVVGK